MSRDVIEFDTVLYTIKSFFIPSNHIDFSPHITLSLILSFSICNSSLIATVNESLHLTGRLLFLLLFISQIILAYFSTVTKLGGKDANMTVKNSSTYTNLGCKTADS